ncbi:histidyl-tRNA synthetase [Basidiobolus meristosporus CBS 931.73]|uniref:Histidine--tRNA ligase, mitochondrial n=1 Tax=Basidiobolus meristosporus CBS 931.73 TaxID=1314790 RepID=A0A1Y1Z3Q6_9FUNG|nr:histidyl-tRNA synthetase [Basidiobolus meristosporus CBS 931.73]|eukprot:ORY04836.1 histidyl-tRNA synthetase [Basidiobolus meristosporus CBS 931.73]
MTSVESLKESITQVGDKVRALKISNADKAEVDAEVAVLLGLKKQLAALTGESTDGKKKKGNAFTLKTPKGTKDYNDKEMAIREHIFSTIINVFKRHGGVTIDTPVFELKEILTGKYGEDSKLIYDLEDQGGEKCALRYDLTVPFARFLAMNGTTYQNIKRYQIAKVYRRDQPAMTKGRMREFYQCDFDIAGTYEPMVPDSEVIRIVVEILSALDVGKFTIKVNHRKILDGLFEVCGVPADKIRTISSAVDKLDKMPWADVRKEMTQDKGLDGAVADKIGEYVKLKGGRDLLEKLEQDDVLMANASAKAGLNDMKLFLRYLEIFKVLEYVSFDLSLARGLDYYTGVIYEAVVEENLLPEITAEMKKKAKEAGDDDSQTRIGSVSAGGRYDNLVGMFAGGSKKSNIPCVGLSIGVERVFSIIMRRSQLESIKSNECEVYVIAVGDGLLEERMQIATELWESGIKAEYMYKAKPKLQAQFSVCDRDRIPWAVIIGKDELEQGIVKIKDMSAKQQENAGGVTISRSEMIQELKKRLGRA